MNKNQMSRRRFLHASAATTGVAMAMPRIMLSDSRIPYAWEAAASDTIRFGIIGIGMQGSGLLGTAVTLPGVQCVAAADLYDGRHTLAKEIAGNKIKTTRKYQELLDDKEIDCLIAAVPDHWHMKVVTDAVNAGKDIYIEKPMSHAPSEGIESASAP
jgi:predicted dehydrogenase